MAVAGDVVERLGRHELFAGLPADVLADIAGEGRLVTVEQGEALLVEHEPSDCAYFVLEGRFVVTVGDAAHRRVVGSAVPGEVLGEMGLLSDLPRAAGAHASRRSVVLRLDQRRFQTLLESHPAIAVRLSRTLGRRLAEANRHLGRRRDALVLGVVVVGSLRPEEVARGLAAALERHGAATACRPVDDGDGDGVDAAATRADVAIVWGRHAGDAAAVSAGADRTWVVARREEAHLVVAPGAEWELVLVHRRGSAPSGTGALVRAHPTMGGFHHTVDGDPCDVDRLARHVLGRPVALVLSGGAARGMVHLGVYRAFVEAGIPIDIVAGTSAGALVGGCLSLRWSPEEATEQIRRHTWRTPVDATLPIVALATGRRITDGMRSVFGDLDVEDCWIPFRCVATNLTTRAVDVPIDGPLWRAVRASVAIPGVFPPVVLDRGVLVDGGLLDNLPVGPVRREWPDATIVSSLVVGPDRRAADRAPSDGVVGLGDLARRALRGRRRTSDDGLVRTLYRLTALGSAAAGGLRGDVHLEHDAGAWAPFDWRAIRAIERAGHAVARAAIDDGRLAPVTAGLPRARLAAVAPR